MIAQSASLLKSLRQEAMALFRDGVAVANPEQAVAAVLVERNAMVEQASRFILVAFGKAAWGTMVPTTRSLVRAICRSPALLVRMSPTYRSC